jgi:hypothetical protein
MEQDDTSHLDIVLLAVSHSPDSRCASHHRELAAVEVVVVDSVALMAFIGTAAIDTDTTQQHWAIAALVFAVIAERAPLWVDRELDDTLIDVLENLQRLIDKELGLARAKDIPCPHFALNANDSCIARYACVHGGTPFSVILAIVGDPVDTQHRVVRVLWIMEDKPSLVADKVAITIPIHATSVALPPLDKSTQEKVDMLPEEPLVLTPTVGDINGADNEVHFSAGRSDLVCNLVVDTLCIRLARGAMYWKVDSWCDQ